jgi:uncharacterized protein (TIGR03067 family)
VRPPTLRLAVAVALVAAATAPSADPKEELKLLAGVWLLDGANLAGRDHADDFAGMKLTVTGDKFAIDFGPNSDTGTITLDAAKSPKQIDIATRKDGPFKGRTLPGIYELKGDKLVLCCDSEAKARPAAFEAKEKTTLMLLTFKRDKK